MIMQTTVESIERAGTKIGTHVLNPFQPYSYYRYNECVWLLTDNGPINQGFHHDFMRRVEDGQVKFFKGVE
jgi:hypothetical protein